MTSADVRDMLDLPSDGRPRPVKKQKTVEKRPGDNFVTRFLNPNAMLMSDQRALHGNCSRYWESGHRP